MDKKKLECNFCHSVYDEPVTGTNSCPACGGYGPKVLEPRVIERIHTEYVYVVTPQNHGYYRKSHQTALEWSYSTFGVKVVGGIFALATIALIAWFAYFWFFYRTGTPKDTDPSYQNRIATPAATVTPYVSDNPWLNTSWISSEEALNLRNQENAINLAYLERGGAKYANSSVVFSAESWQMAKPLGVTEKSVSGTSVTLKINSDEYHLNTYQPFVIKNQEKTLYLVDSTGQIWSIALSDVTLVDLETAQSSLPVVISQNSELSPTY